MISIIITAYKEPKTISKAINSILSNKINEKYEILIVAPDKETLDIAKRFENVRILKDKGEGKPSALNLAVSKSKGDILILTDGDVYVSNDSLNFLIYQV